MSMKKCNPLEENLNQKIKRLVKLLNFNRGDSLSVNAHYITIFYKNRIKKTSVNEVDLLFDFINEVNNIPVEYFKDSGINPRAVEHRKNKDNKIVKPRQKKYTGKCPYFLYFIDREDIKESRDSRGDILYYYDAGNKRYLFFSDKITPRGVRIGGKAYYFLSEDLPVINQ